MKTYSVTIRASIYKTFVLDATDEEAAYQLAHEKFSPMPQEGVRERYEEETVDIEESTPCLECGEVKVWAYNKRCSFCDEGEGKVRV